MAGLEAKRRRSGGGGSDGDDDNDGTGGGHHLGSLTGIGAVQHVFHFLDGPADVLRASIASRRWRELATGDAVWRPKAVREGMVEKAGVFEVALPSVEGDEGDAASSSSSGGNGGGTAEDEEDELLGVGLAFYAQVFVLKVGTGYAKRKAKPSEFHRRRRPSLLSPARLPPLLPSAPSAGVQDEG